MMIKTPTIPFVRTVSSKAVLVNPIADTTQVTSYLDQVRTQLQQVAIEQDLPDAFTIDGTLSADLQETALGQQYTTLQQQAQWLEQIKSDLTNAGKIGGTVLLLSGTGAVAMYIHQKGWLKQVAQRLRKLPQSFRRASTPITPATGEPPRHR